MNDKYKEFFGKMNSKDFKDMQVFLCANSGFLLSSSIILSMFAPYEQTGLSLIALISTLISSGFVLSNGANYTKDVQELKRMYDEFIKEYNKLNRILEFNNPLEIETLFCYMYSHGYLSRKKYFNYLDDTKSLNKPVLMGCDIFNGVGVCRNISTMLNDIYSDYGIESCILGVLQYDNNGDNNIKLINHIAGNHAITYAYKDGIDYYLDPTQNRIYYRNNNYLYDEEKTCKVKPFQTKILSLDKDKYYNFINRYHENNDTIDYDYIRRIIFSTRMIIENNKYILSRFYYENCELYEEMGNKLLLIK